jgi:hypothetical protein
LRTLIHYLRPSRHFADVGLIVQIRGQNFHPAGASSICPSGSPCEQFSRAG